jgi:hypothetical protein
MSETNGVAVVSKASAIRKVLNRKGGMDLTATEVAVKVKDEFGLDVSGPSVYQERRKISGDDKPAAAPAVKSEPAKSAPADEPLSVQNALLAVKELAAKVGGVDNLVALVSDYKALVS